MRHYNQILPRKWLFIQGIIFRLEILHCCVDQGHEKWHSGLNLVTYDLEHEVRLVFYGLTLLELSRNKVINQIFVTLKWWKCDEYITFPHKFMMHSNIPWGNWESNVLIQWSFLLSPSDLFLCVLPWSWICSMGYKIIFPQLRSKYYRHYWNA